jgi:NAD(P)-dependent dehydrogenase (short-subunit alcohol dehydrogenase family)
MADLDVQTKRTVLITGASRGLGLALARALARGGWSLIIDARGSEALEKARAELGEQTTVERWQGMSPTPPTARPWHRRLLMQVVSMRW